ncbi:MAG: hypothetical protein ACPGSB_08430 [Opitutales bacterium]
MNDTAITIFFLIGIFVILPLGLLFLRDRISDFFWKKRNPPEKLEADRKEYEIKILSPDWSFYENHLSRSVPGELKELWSDSTLVTSGGFDYDGENWVSTFNPLSEETLIEHKQVFEREIVPILTTGFGDPVYLKPGATEVNRLYITYHDGGDTEVFEEDITSFVKKLKSQPGEIVNASAAAGKPERSICTIEPFGSHRLHSSLAEINENLSIPIDCFDRVPHIPKSLE